MSRETLIPYRKLSNFHKVLFLQHQVKTLIASLKNALVEKGKLESELQELIHTDKSARRIKSLTEENKNLRDNRNHWKMLYEKELSKNQKS